MQLLQVEVSAAHQGRLTHLAQARNMRVHQLLWERFLYKLYKLQLALAIGSIGAVFLDVESILAIRESVPPRHLHLPSLPKRLELDIVFDPLGSSYPLRCLDFVWLVLLLGF
jgi:hypothetical protein